MGCLRRDKDGNIYYDPDEDPNNTDDIIEDNIYLMSDEDDIIDEDEEIDPDEYNCTIVDLLTDINRIESGKTNKGINAVVAMPILVTPLNRFIYFKKYDYDYSLLLKLLNQGVHMEQASKLLYDVRIEPYVYDYIFKNEYGEMIDEDELHSLIPTDDMYPNSDEPFWYINLKK
jgi:hypothetical protein